jgi:hypothetical protein
MREIQKETQLISQKLGWEKNIGEKKNPTAKKKKLDQF